MDLQKIIDKKDLAAKYMIDEITHICTKFEKSSTDGSRVFYKQRDRGN